MPATDLSSEELQRTLVEALQSDGSIKDTRELVLPSGKAVGPEPEQQSAVKAALDSLAGKEYLTYTIQAVEVWSLTAEGETFVAQGSPEFRVWSAVEGAGKSIKELQALLGPEITKIGQSNAFKRKWIAKKGDTFAQAVSQSVFLRKHVVELAFRLRRLRMRPSEIF